jgi:hypothetical protein
MDFVDQTLLSLADPALRATLLDQESLQAVLTSAQDGPALDTTGPYTATFDLLELGPDLGGAAADGCWSAVDGSSRTMAQFSVSGLSDTAAPPVAAVWIGTITANATTGDARVSAVGDTWASAGAGEEFEATATLTLTPSAAVAAAAPTTFALTAAVFISDAPLALLELLRASARARAQVATARPAVTAPNVINTTLPIAVWLVNQTVFDDTAWPGAAAGANAADARDARRARAAQWLAAQQIGLAVVT